MQIAAQHHGRCFAGRELRALGACKQLQELHLKGCYKLTNLSVAALRHLTSLTLLNLHECWQITAAGVASLSSKLTLLTQKSQWLLQGLQHFQDHV